MAESGEQRFWGSETAAMQGWLRLLHEREKLKRFLLRLAARQGLKRAGRSSTQDVKTLKVIEFRLKAGAQGGRSYLERCCEAVLDAHTIEDAIFWHCEIITELTVEMHAVEGGNLPSVVKASTIATIEERVRSHGILLDRLTGVVQRNEQFVWEP